MKKKKKQQQHPLFFFYFFFSFPKPHRSPTKTSSEEKEKKNHHHDNNNDDYCDCRVASERTRASRRTTSRTVPLEETFFFILRGGNAYLKTSGKK
jgi:hypothetical protein